MKEFKFSVLQRGFKRFALLGAMTLSVPLSFSTEAIAQTTPTDQNYLTDLYTFLQGQDTLAYGTATFYDVSNDLNIWMAQSVCHDLANGRSVASMYDEFMAGARSTAVMPTQEAAEQVDYSLGLYIGSVMNLGSAYYCPQHQSQVVQALRDL